MIFAVGFVRSGGKVTVILTIVLVETVELKLLRFTVEVPKPTVVVPNVESVMKLGVNNVILDEVENGVVFGLRLYVNLRKLPAVEVETDDSPELILAP